MKKTLLLLFLSASISMFAQSFSTGEQTLLTGFTAKIDIDGPSGKTTLTLKAPSNVWFAIGFGGQNMSAGVDVFRTDGTNITDAFSNARALPPADSSQDWTMVSNTVSGGTRTMVVSRANNTGDSSDYVFNASAGSIPVIYAHGSSTVYANHLGTRGFTTLGVTLGIPEAKKLEFSMYPNPVKNVVGIQLPTGTRTAEVGIFDYTGRRVRVKRITATNDQLNVTDLASGMYIIRVLSKNKIGAQKFVKE